MAFGGTRSVWLLWLLSIFDMISIDNNNLGVWKANKKKEKKRKRNEKKGRIRVCGPGNKP